MQSDWNSAVAEAIRSIGGADFPPRLQAALACLLPFQICMVFAYQGRARPEPLYHNMTPARADVVVARYCNGPYLLDPIFGAVSSGQRAGIATLRQLAPDRFFQSEYHLDHYHRTAIADELAIFAALPGQGCVVISVARDQGVPGFSARERAAVAACAPVIEALAAAHWGAATAARDAPAALPLESFGAGQLTPREIDVIGLVLKGHSTGSVGQVLQISPATVKMHRKNAYRKLAISSQAQLFARFIGAAG